MERDVRMSKSRQSAIQSGDEAAWVRDHLGHLCCDTPRPSTRFRGTQAAADAALDSFSVVGYAARRNEVAPRNRRGASGLSPWIRHGLLSLPIVWKAASPGPARDVEKFRDELLWQEYARHLYARIGPRMSDPIRFDPATTPLRDSHRTANPLEPDGPWNRSMKCVEFAMSELEEDGWLVNQTRMWLASQWTVRHGANWRVGEDHFFTHLLDGSRAANRLGWQWTIGAGTGKAYGFSRWQVNKRAPGLCGDCPLQRSCPIESWPPDADLHAVNEPKDLRSMPTTTRSAGPTEPERTGEPEVVWITAESLGDSDPALDAHRSLPVVFVFDEPLLQRLQLSGKRLVFIAERLAELANTRELSVHLGDPATILAGSSVATTFAPVPGWKRIAKTVNPVEVHPWPWLRTPGTGSLASFSAWRNTSRR